MSELRVLALSGSLRTASWNSKLLKTAAEALRSKGVIVDIFDFKAANIPVYDADIHEANPAAGVVDFKNRLRAAHGFMLASPEYNYSIPGGLKNLFDIASRPPAENPFKGKVSAQLGATPGPGGTLQAQVSIRHILSGLMCFPLPGQFVVSKAAEAFDEKGQLKDEMQRKQLDALLDRFVAELKLRNP